MHVQNQISDCIGSKECNVWVSGLRGLSKCMVHTAAGTTGPCLTCRPDDITRTCTDPEPWRSISLQGSLDLTEKSYPTTHGKTKMDLIQHYLFWMSLHLDCEWINFSRFIWTASEENQPHLMASPDHYKTRPWISATFGLEAGHKYTAR